MFIEKEPKQPETLAAKILSRARDYDLANPKGPVFDRLFNRHTTEREIDKSNNIVGQGVSQISFPNGMSPDGFSSFSPTIGYNSVNVDEHRVFNQTAENQVTQFWMKNRERVQKYYRIASRAEVGEAIDQICDEAVYEDGDGKICELSIDLDAQIGDVVKNRMYRIFRQEVLNKIMNFRYDGWNLMRTLLIEGRIFFEVVYSKEKNQIVGVNLLPSQNMIIVVQDGIIIGYRQMLEGSYSSVTGAGMKNYVDFSPNQILYGDLNLFGPGGINDPRSPLEVAVKPFNQINAIEDAVTMYRIQWGSEKLVFKIDTGTMPKPKAEAHIKEVAKQLSRRVDYNSATGEVSNYGRVIGLSEHIFLSVNSNNRNSSVERLQGGEKLGDIDDLKYFKRNLVNAMKVPPGRITALAGDGTNYANGKFGEVTQAEVAFARLVYRYQVPMKQILSRLFVMVLDTMNDITPDVKKEEYFTVNFNKGNSFQRNMDSEILQKDIGIFNSVTSSIKSPSNPDGVLSKDYVLRRILHLSDVEISKMNEDLAEIDTPEEGGEE
jgi:Bacteriophage T4-like capsid assembly protein (Gp20).